MTTQLLFSVLAGIEAAGDGPGARRRRPTQAGSARHGTSSLWLQGRSLDRRMWRGGYTSIYAENQRRVSDPIRRQRGIAALNRRNYGEQLNSRIQPPDGDVGGREH